ncbi:MAG: hypothetical protein ACRC1Z_01485 [Waterburya sp.]
MKTATKKAATAFGAFLVFTFIYEFRDIVNPTALSRARERFVIKTVLLGIGLVGFETFTKK